MAKRYLFQLEYVEPTTSWLFFRAVGDEDAGNFVVEPEASQFIIDSLGDDSLLDDLQTALYSALRERRFARAFFLDGDEALRRSGSIAHYLIFVGAMGQAWWIPLNTGLKATSWFQEGAAFWWTRHPDARRFLATPALEIWAQIQSQKEDPDSDCAFARRALTLSDEEMNGLFCRWNQGTRSELQRVLAAALLSQTDLWNEQTGYDWTVDLDRLKLPWHRGELSSLSRNSGLSPLDTPDALRDILRRVSHYFEPTFDEQLLATHLQATRWRERFQNALRVRIESPSSHERLEAALFWEEWQKAHPAMR